jgi:uncharacterized protein
MKCPLCSVDLTMSERSGVEIDYCPKCRGVWLDRGELDKIISLSAASGAQRQGSYNQDNDFDDRNRERRRSEYADDDYRGGERKRGSWLGDLFDFGD